MCVPALLTLYLVLYWAGGAALGWGGGALAGILECVRLSACLCLDKAACPLSLMPPAGSRYAVHAPEIERQLHTEGQGRTGPGRAHRPRPQLIGQWETGYCLEPEAKSWRMKLAKRLISFHRVLWLHACVSVCVWVDRCQGGWSGSGKVIGALESLCHASARLHSDEPTAKTWAHTVAARYCGQARGDYRNTPPMNALIQNETLLRRPHF